METQYIKAYSNALGRDMECKIYGHAGRPVLFIPCQDGRFFDFENFNMTDTWGPWIDSRWSPKRCANRTTHSFNKDPAASKTNKQSFYCYVSMIHFCYNKRMYKGKHKRIHTRR